METLDIQFTDWSEGYLEATMPVTPKVHQPAGLLHGGASMALAESIGSCGSAMIVGSAGNIVGLEINANHIRSMREGLVTAKATLLHGGRKTHVWEIRIENEEGKPVSICRMTNMILEK